MQNLRHNLIHLLLTGIALLSLTGPVLAQSELDALIDEVRATAVRSVGPDRLGSGYGAMINFAVSPDISTATYNIDSEAGNDPELKVTRVPLKHVFISDDRDWSPFVQGNLVYQTLDAGFEFAGDEFIDTEWRAFGGSLTAGAELPVTEKLNLVPSVNVGLVRLESDASYHGEISNAILKPALQGLVFDWDADARLFGASLGFDFRQDFEGFDLKAHGSLSHNRIETYSSSSGLIDFSSHATTLALQVDAVHPTTKTLSGFPIALVVHAGGTGFLGSNRDVLGFDHFFEAGLALEADVSRKEWRVKKLRFGAKAILGADVKGWGLILGYRFR